MGELFVPDFSSMETPCYSSSVVCEETDCWYWERTTPEYGNCTIRVANRGPHKLTELAAILGVSRERIRQIEASALRHLAWIATKRGLTRDVVSIVTASLGDVCSWPPHPHGEQRYNRTYTTLELIDKAFYLGVISHFLKTSQPLPVVECWILDRMVSGFVCLLCPERLTCPSTTLGTVDPSQFLTVSSFSELVRKVKEDLGITGAGEEEKPHG